ncbi:MAG: Asp23/Gls24 family envelope stress response protein [Ruminococcaceae bacterium]|nr:Asp23/Gls24 family envelope stress response protein [Oscillospiraceae bacterium]
MDEFNSHAYGGSLQISSEVIEKIARQAALEVDGVANVTPIIPGARTLLAKLPYAKPIHVEIKNEAADIMVSIVVKYGAKIPELSGRVQQNVKDAVQSMTNIMVGRVDLVVNGVDTGASE